MRRTVLVVMAVLVTVLSPLGVTVAAADSGGQGAEGGGVQAQTFQFAFSAHRNVNGQVTGHFKDTDTFFGTTE